LKEVYLGKLITKFYFSDYFFLEKKVAKIQGCETMAKNYGGKPTIGKDVLHSVHLRARTVPMA
jgi:hypothetical protein